MIATPAGGAPEDKAKIVSRIIVPVSNRIGGLRDPSGIHGIEEVAVGLGLLQLVDQELDRVGGAHRCQDAAQYENLLQILFRHQQVLLAGTGLENIH